MPNNASDCDGRNAWGRKCLDSGIKLVVAVVDETTAQLVREAAGTGKPCEWGDPNRLVADPGPGGIARVLTTSIYQDLLGFSSNLMILDPAVAADRAWDVLCDYFSTCGPAGERLLLLRPLSLPPDVPEENVTVILAPEELTVQFLRQQLMDAPIRPVPDEEDLG